MTPLILHLIGDYVTQSDWMANGKTKAHWPAFCHALVYALPFGFLCSSWLAWLVIFGTHFFIDRYRLARFVVYAKNIVFDWRSWTWPALEEGKAFAERMQWSNCSTTGYPSDVPPWLAVWLLIAADNTMHLAINAVALAWL